MKARNLNCLRFTSLSLFLLVTALTTSALSQPLRVGVVGDLSFGNREVNAISHAVLLAIDDSRKAGILTQEVTVITNDDQCKPDVAVNQAMRFADLDRVSLVIGHTCAGASLAASKTYQERRILQIDPTTTHPSLTEQMRGKNAALFRIANRQDRAAAVAVVVLRNQIANKNVCLIGGPSKKAWLDRFQAAATGVKKFSLSETMPDQRSGHDLCVVYGPQDQQGLERIGKQDTVVYGVYGLDDRFPSPTANVDAIKGLVARMKAAGHSSPLESAINAYAAVQIWARAMKEARSAESTKVAEQMRMLKFDTIRGLVAFDETGDVRQPLVTILRFDGPVIQVPNDCNEDRCKDCKCDGCCSKN